MRADHRFTLELVGHDIARHVPYGLRRHEQNGFGFGQVAELDGVVFREVFCSALANDFADPAMAGDPEIILGDGDLQFR